jgi:hypothetical protein
MDAEMTRITDNEAIGILNDAFDTVENLSDAEVEALTLDPTRQGRSARHRLENRPYQISGNSILCGRQARNADQPPIFI